MSKELWGQVMGYELWVAGKWEKHELKVYLESVEAGNGW